MKILQFALAVAPFGFAFAAAKTAHAENGPRVSGPISHDNLTVYFLHGPSAEGAVPLTLQEALAKDSVRVSETGDVNELVIENLGSEDIFIQSGDIVKGGRQDRVLTTTLVLPPKSGKTPVAAFCVEQGRWAARGAENVAAFAFSSDTIPSREAKLAMKAPRAAPAERALPAGQGNRDDGASRQGEVWRSVSQTQTKLSANLAAAVAAPASETSLQLSLENESLQKARAAYVSTLEEKGGAEGDIVGYVFAVNGKINGADLYPSNALFRKMWPKMLAAGVTEAIGERDGEKSAAPPVEKIAEFLAAAEKGGRHEEEIAKLMRIETRDAPEALFVESKGRDGRWTHRNYVAK